MPHTYLQEVEKIIEALSEDEELMLEEKVILLRLVTDYIKEVSYRLEADLATFGGLIQ